MKELAGVDWPLDEKTKGGLRALRLKRREKLLSKPENRRHYDEMGLNYRVAELLQDARITAHLTQQELAAKLNTSQPNLARIERGQNITLKTLDEYAHICGKSVHIQLV